MLSNEHDSLRRHDPRPPGGTPSAESQPVMVSSDLVSRSQRLVHEIEAVRHRLAAGRPFTFTITTGLDLLADWTAGATQADRNTIYAIMFAAGRSSPPRRATAIQHKSMSQAYQ